MKHTLLVVVLLSLPLTVAAQNRGTITTKSKFEIGQHDLSIEFREELRTLCPQLTGEEHIVVKGHYDEREYPLNNAKMQFLLGLNRAKEAAEYISNMCGISMSGLSLQSSFNHGDPSDPQGKESRTVTFFWGFGVDSFHAVTKEYDEDMNEFLRTWKGESLSNQEEMLALLGILLEQSRWSERTYRFVTDSLMTKDDMIPSRRRWFVKGGLRVSSQFGNGLALSLGTSSLAPRTEIFVEGYGEWSSHEKDLYSRPDPETTSLHWGSWYTGSFFARKYVGREEWHMSPFLDLGIGFAHVEYDGPPDTSIGWHHTGLLSTLRVGAQINKGRFGAEILFGEEFWNFPTRPVDPLLADGEFHVSGMFSTQLIVRL